MGQYEPGDSRNITLGEPKNPIEPPRTGPREDEAREMARQGEQQRPAQHQMSEQQQRGAQTRQSAGSGSQFGYGNMRDADGHSEQEMAQESDDEEADEAAIPAELSSRDDIRARADAERPLGKD